MRYDPDLPLEVPQSPGDVDSTTQGSSVSIWEGRSPFYSEDYISEMARHLPDVTQQSDGARAPGFLFFPAIPRDRKVSVQLR